MSSVGASGTAAPCCSQSQRTTPDVLRSAACGATTDTATVSTAPTPHGPVAGGTALHRGPWRQRRHHGRQPSPGVLTLYLEVKCSEGVFGA